MATANGLSYSKADLRVAEKALSGLQSRQRTNRCTTRYGVTVKGVFTESSNHICWGGMNYPKYCNPCEDGLLVGDPWWGMEYCGISLHNKIK